MKERVQQTLPGDMRSLGNTNNSPQIQPQNISIRMENQPNREKDKPEKEVPEKKNPKKEIGRENIPYEVPETPQKPSPEIDITDHS